MAGVGAENTTLEFTSTWVVAMVCSVIVLISIVVHRFLQCAGQLLSKPFPEDPKASKDEGKDEDKVKDDGKSADEGQERVKGQGKGRRKHLFDALQKIKEELMLLGFISLLLSVFQTRIGKICISETLANVWLPCHQNAPSSSTTTAHFSTNPIPSDGYRGRRLLADTNTTDHCGEEGKVPLLSLTAVHHIHIFIFVLATFHVIVSVAIILCGKARLYYWRKWEQFIIKDGRFIDEKDRRKLLAKKDGHSSGEGNRLATVIRGLRMIGKHFFPSLTKSEYIAIRLYGIKGPYSENPKYHFEKYVIRGVQKDFDKVVGISWYLWLFVVLFLLLNVAGWNAYFWISFLPLALLLAVGAKLEHMVKQQTEEIFKKYDSRAGASGSKVPTIEFSEKDFWFQNPDFFLDLIHIILFQNSFELAFFFFILFQYGFHSCIMGEVGYVIPRLVIGVCVLIMCCYRTLPLYAIIKKQLPKKPDREKKEKEMKIVTFIWYCIEKWNARKMPTNSGSTQGGSREGLAAKKQTKVGEIEPEKGADIEAQDVTKPASTSKPGEQRLV